MLYLLLESTDLVCFFIEQVSYSLGFLSELTWLLSGLFQSVLLV